MDFKNTVIILTSNIGSHALYDASTPDRSSTYKEDAMQLIKSYFSPEFLNRLDDVIVFNRLSLEDTKTICKIQLRRLSKLLQSRNLVMEITADAEDYLATKGFSAHLGARPLKRLIQKEIMDPLATMILEVLMCFFFKPSKQFQGKYSDGDRISVVLTNAVDEVDGSSTSLGFEKV